MTTWTATTETRQLPATGAALPKAGLGSARPRGKRPEHAVGRWRG